MSTPQRDRVDWVPVYNTTNETIPSGAVARVTGVTDGVLQLAKPNAAGDTKVIVVGLTSVPAGKYGRGTFDPRAVAAYDPADGPPAAADQLGSASGSWYLVAGNAGFRALGGAGNGLVNVVREAGSGTPSPLTTKGDVWGYSTTDARIPVGADGQVLTADSTQTLGVKWASGGYTTVQEEGVSLTQRATLNFIGSGVTAADFGATKTNVTVHDASRTQNGTVTTASQGMTGKKTLYHATTGAAKPVMIFDPDSAGSYCSLGIYHDSTNPGAGAAEGIGLRIYSEDNAGSPRVRFMFETGFSDEWVVQMNGGATANRTTIPELGLTTPLELGSGGTGAGLADPGADRILFWDDSAGAMTWLQLGGGLAISTTTLNVVSAGTYTPTNVTTDRSYDANATTLDEIADVLGTLIGDLQAKGYLS